MRFSFPTRCTRVVLSAFLALTTVGAEAADCDPEPAGFEPWPRDRPPPIESIDVEHWYGTPQGWIVAPDRCNAIVVAVELAAAFRAYARHFGLHPAPGAVLDIAHAARIDELRDAGVAWVLPWRFESADEPDPRAASIRAQIVRQLSAGGEPPDPARVDALVETALGRLGGAGTPTGSGALEPKAIRHEVAHLLFLHGVWPSSSRTPSQYGGDAPDWLDEAAAIVAESDAMTADRRRAFRAAAAEGTLIPLARYLSMPHPVFGDPAFAAMIDDARARAAQEGAVVLSATVDPEDLAEGRRFYSQTRGFVDYLFERSRLDTVLGVMARSMREGRSFEDWLAEQAAHSALPPTLAELEADFRRWALERP